MFVKQPRLPFEPLEKMFNNEITIEDLAKIARVDSSTVWNWKKDGVPEPQADRVAIRLGLHPASIWEMTGGRWRTCLHCGTVERALTPLPQHVHDTCGCPCHAWRMGKLTASEPRWQKKGSKRKRNV